MLVENVLGSDAFWLVNKKLAREIGLEAAIVLSDIIAKRKYFRNRAQLDGMGGFFNNVCSLENDLNIGRDRRRRAFKKLEALGFLRIKKRGVPAKNYYYINDDIIIKFLSEVETDLTGEVETSRTGGVETDLTINNNKYNNNKNNIKLHEPNGSSHTNIVKYIYNLMETRYGKPVKWLGGKYGKSIKELLKIADEELIKRKCIELLYMMEYDDFYSNIDFNPSTLMSRWNYIKTLDDIRYDHFKSQFEKGVA